MPCDSTILNPKALEIGNCITARYDAGIQNKGSIGIAVCEAVSSKRIGGMFDDEKHIRQLEPNVLRAERTEYGKAIRKQYEKGEITEKIGNMREYNPRTDGVSNTLTTVQKDNYLFETNYRIRKLTP